MTECSDLPWTSHPNLQDTGFIYDSRGTDIGQFDLVRNRDRAIRAVNAHAALVDACEGAIKALDGIDDCLEWDDEIQALASALALAKGEAK